MRRAPPFWKVFFGVLLLAVLWASAARAEVLNLDLVQDHINISTGFTGATLTLFGTKKGRGEIVVVLEGPEKKNVVRRKEKVLGAWVNRSWLDFARVPAYYDFADNVFKETDLMPEAALQAKGIGLKSFMRPPVKERYDADTTRDFQKALIRNKQKLRLYPTMSQNVVFLDKDFFRVDFPLPANVPRGDYTVRVMLVRDGVVVEELHRRMTVGQTGMSAAIYKKAYHESLLYGALCIVIACAAGWLSNFLVKK